MKAYKLCRIDEKGNLHPLFVGCNIILLLGVILEAVIGDKISDDGKHVKSKLGWLSLRPGWHLALVPDSKWIGKADKETGELIRRKDNVWVECEVLGDEIEVAERNGLRTVPNGWYRFKTNSKQKIPWIIARYIRLIRVLPNDEVVAICAEHGIKAQRVEA